MAENPWAFIPVVENHEPLIPLPDLFLFATPHPYKALGAVYKEDESPFSLRSSAVLRLLQAQDELARRLPGARFKIFDGYRPLSVQSFLLHADISRHAQEEGMDPSALSSADRERLLRKALVYLSAPSEDPAHPPLHSTGGCVDLTIVDEAGDELPMGTGFDDFSSAAATKAFETSSAPEANVFRRNRQLLCHVMEGAGFINYAEEWWHFGFGDQHSAWVLRSSGREPSASAVYGRADLA